MCIQTQYRPTDGYTHVHMDSSTHARNAHTHTDRQTGTRTHIYSTYSGWPEDTGTYCKQFDQQRRRQQLRTHCLQHNDLKWTGLESYIRMYKILRTPLHTHTYIHIYKDTLLKVCTYKRTHRQTKCGSTVRKALKYESVWLHVVQL